MDPAAIELPESFSTERLDLRAPRVGYAEELCAAIEESFDELSRWMPWAKSVLSVDECRARLESGRKAFLARADLPLHVFLKNTNTLVGSTGLHRFDWSVPRFEIGYWVRRRFRGRGFVTEWVQGLTDFAFRTLKAQRVEIHASAANQRACRVAERAGYELEAVLRRYDRHPDGSLRDTRIYARLANESRGFL